MICPNESHKLTIKSPQNSCSSHHQAVSVSMLNSHELPRDHPRPRHSEPANWPGHASPYASCGSLAGDCPSHGTVNMACLFIDHYLETPMPPRCFAADFIQNSLVSTGMPKVQEPSVHGFRWILLFYSFFGVATYIDN